jgi:hypothetical protein
VIVVPEDPPKLDLGRIVKFNPANQDICDFTQLQVLDSLPAKGLSADRFSKLFAQCAACLNFMTKRSVGHHSCSESDTGKLSLSFRRSQRGGSHWQASFSSDAGLTVQSASAMYLLSVVDAYNPDREAGIPEALFAALFTACKKCGAHMTKRVAEYHRCGGALSFEWQAIEI